VEKGESILVVVVGHEKVYVLLLRKNAKNWQTSNFIFVLNVLIFPVNYSRNLIVGMWQNME
jgi:hypothetical protein